MYLYSILITLLLVISSLLLLSPQEPYTKVVYLSNPVPDKFHPKIPEDLFVYADMLSVMKKEHEKRLLSEVVFFESRGESNELYMLGVIHTVLNRVKSPNFPDSIEKVINSPYAFSYLNRNNNPLNTYDPKVRQKIMDLPENAKSVIISNRLAHKVITDRDNGRLVDVTNGALYYLNPKKLSRLPSWVDYKYHVATLGNHHYFSWHLYR